MATDILSHHAVPDRPLGALTGHWRAWRRRDALDRLLVEGSDPAGSPELALRAHQLTEQHHRRHLAAELRSVVAAVDGPDPERYAIDLCADEVRVARTLLLELAVLVSAESQCPRGVAMARLLLRDPSSPLYAPSANDELWRACRAACRASATA